MENQPYLSVVVPAYKDEERIGRTLLEIQKYFNDKNYEWEIIVVLDGSPDNTGEIVKNYANRIKNFRVIENKENHGKGCSVRQGLLEAKGKRRLFMDADGSTSITHLDKFLPEMENGYDIVIGSRYIEGAFVQIHQGKMRETMGKIGNLMIKIILGLWKYSDTQCGFKIISGKAVDEVVKKMTVDRFGFDFELIKLAEVLGFKIKQMPVRWLNEEGSTVTLFGPNSFIQSLVDLFKTRYGLLTGKYNLKAK
ncbi:MAG: dolichyl-phosphate beta-glucosyltransferase [Parcubacteria group bacterium]|jgi:dolichyl-phosphate beta-glucosyltransferase